MHPRDSGTACHGRGERLRFHPAGVGVRRGAGPRARIGPRGPRRRYRRSTRGWGRKRSRSRRSGPKAPRPWQSSTARRTPPHRRGQRGVAGAITVETRAGNVTVAPRRPLDLSPMDVGLPLLRPPTRMRAYLQLAALEPAVVDRWLRPCHRGVERRRAADDCRPGAAGRVQDSPAAPADLGSEAGRTGSEERTDR